MTSDRIDWLAAADLFPTWKRQGGFTASDRYWLTCLGRISSRAEKLLFLLIGFR